jgi:hypothetical protein
MEPTVPSGLPGGQAWHALPTRPLAMLPAWPPPGQAQSRQCDQAGEHPADVCAVCHHRHHDVGGAQPSVTEMLYSLAEVKERQIKLYQKQKRRPGQQLTF